MARERPLATTRPSSPCPTRFHPRRFAVVAGLAEQLQVVVIQQRPAITNLSLVIEVERATHAAHLTPGATPVDDFLPFGQPLTRMVERQGRLRRSYQPVASRAKPIRRSLQSPHRLARSSLRMYLQILPGDPGDEHPLFDPGPRNRVDNLRAQKS